MSWTRTGLAMLVAAATLLRWAGAYPALMVVVVCALALGGLVIEVLNRRSYLREASALADERSAPNTASIFLLTAMIVGVGCVAFYLVVVA